MVFFVSSTCRWTMRTEQAGLNGDVRQAMIIPVSAPGARPMSIYEQVLSFIHRPEPDLFQQLAMNVFRHQYEAVASYRRYCEACGVDPGSVHSADEVPAVSNVAFKYADLAVEAAAESPEAAIFLTSGTTQGRERRGRHIVARPDVYRASAIAHLRTMLFPDDRRMPILAMHPTSDLMPESSLSAMISWCIAEFATGTHLTAASPDRVAFNIRSMKSGSSAKMYNPSGAGRSLTQVMTASAESISSTGRIGPKTSSFMIGESKDTSTRTVGAM